MNKNVKRTIYLTSIFIGFLVLYFFYYIIRELLNGQAGENISLFLNNFLFTVTLLLCFIMLISILVKKKIFNKSIWIQGRVLSIIYLLTSILFPRFKGYKTNFEVIAWGNFTFIDGRLLLLGLLIAFLCYVYNVGLKNQDKIDHYM